ncbi:MAG TPA: hypothetical protein P5058_05275 [Eubacteriales bacterium]|nr:hypothetical protein [Eubacteriales bacterium]
MPQVPMTVGLLLFAGAILGDICRLRPPARPLAQWTLPVVAVFGAAIYLFIAKVILGGRI